MKISLRKANALQLAINEAINSISINVEIEINQFEVPMEVLATRREEFLKNMARREALTIILYDIRKNVGHANSVSGIDTILADIARIEKKMQTASAISKQRPMIDEKVITGKLDKIRNQTETAYYGNDEFVRTSFLTQADLDNYKLSASTLKKQKQNLQDQLLELNVRTEIDLDETAVKILESEQLL